MMVMTLFSLVLCRRGSQIRDDIRVFNKRILNPAMMMKEGVFREHRPDVIFAQHVWPELPVGRVGVRSGVMTGASDRFK
jgi:hypothetical protein